MPRDNSRPANPAATCACVLFRWRYPLIVARETDALMRAIVKTFVKKKQYSKKTESIGAWPVRCWGGGRDRDANDRLACRERRKKYCKTNNKKKFHKKTKNTTTAFYCAAVAAWTITITSTGFFFWLLDRTKSVLVFFLMSKNVREKGFDQRFAQLCELAAGVRLLFTNG